MPIPSRYISLVLDDSGSMFYGGGTSLDRWSAAKYSLEVFAAMLGERDTLDVFLTSDFADAAASGEPQLQLVGSMEPTDRVARVHAMQLKGGGTPYTPVQRAMERIGQTSADQKWLVVLSDGQFDGRSAAEVTQDFRRLLGSDDDANVAFMAIGPTAPTIPNDPAARLHFAHAAGSSDVLPLMTEFSNRTFQRTELTPDANNRVQPDIDLEELLVFAQGRSVEVRAIRGLEADIPPGWSVGVSWAQNQPANYDNELKPAVPNTDLNGQFASFADVPSGTWELGVEGARTVDAFYRPKVRFGWELLDVEENPVVADRIVGGTYRLHYGFMDANCEFIQTSALLGDVIYTAEIIANGETIAENHVSGNQIHLEAGTVELWIKAHYLENHTSEATAQFSIMRPPLPAEFTAQERSFNVTDLADPQPPEGALQLNYAQLQDGQPVPFSAEEWAAVEASSIIVTSDSNLDFDVSLGDEPGAVYVVPRAPDGDIYAADVGDVPLQIEASHVFDDQMNQASSSLTIEVVDNLSWMDRLLNWLATEGWKWALGLAGLILLCGYLFKKRFSRRIKARPTINFMPRSLGVPRREGKGKFRINTARKFLPFVADTATLIYVLPGGSGFRALKLKASKSKTMQIVNWKQLAERRNVAINGTVIDQDTKRPPVMGPSSTITATDSQGRYESSLNA